MVYIVAFGYIFCGLVTVPEDYGFFYWESKPLYVVLSPKTTTRVVFYKYYSVVV